MMRYRNLEEREREMKAGILTIEARLEEIENQQNKIKVSITAVCRSARGYSFVGHSILRGGGPMLPAALTD